MAMDFPDAPVVGDVFGPYMWDGEKWITSGTSEGGGGGLDQTTADVLYVNVSGDTMTGPLVLPGDPTLDLEAATKAYVDALIASGGGGGGSGGAIPDDAPADSLVYGRCDNAWEEALPIWGGILTGPLDGTSLKLRDAATAAGFHIKGPTGNSYGIISSAEDPDGTDHGLWQLFLGDGWPAMGGSIGSNFQLLAFDDAGVGTSVLQIDRASGLATIIGDPVAALGIATKQYVDAAAGGGGGGGDFLPLTGGALTGALGLPAGTNAAPSLYLGDVRTGFSSNAFGELVALSINGTTKLTVDMFALTATAPIRGNAGNPSSAGFAFSNDVNTGLYRKGQGSVSMSAGAMEVMNWSNLSKTTTAYGPVVLAADPVAALEAATKQYVDANAGSGGGGDTGLADAPVDGKQYGRQDAAWTEIMASAGGGGGDFDQVAADALYVKLLGDTMTGALHLPNGTNAAPALSFATAGNGFSADASSVKVSIAGQPIFTFGSGYLSTSLAIRGADGWSGNPAYAFGSEFNSGLFKKASGSVSISVSAQEVINWKGVDKSTTVYGPLMLKADPIVALEAASKQYVDAAVAGAGGAPPPLAIAFSFPGKPAAGAIVTVAVATPMTVAANLAGSVGYTQAGPSANAVFTLNKITPNADLATETITQLGTVEAAGGLYLWTLAGPGGTVAAGDILQLVAPAVQDATLSDICITLLADRA